MKRIALLEYKFILDENVPWRNLAQFETDLGHFFDGINISMEDVEVKGNSTEKIFYLTRKDPIAVAPPIVNKVMTFGAASATKKGK